LFRQDPDVAQKSDKTPVTIADQMVETALRKAIGDAFPDHNIRGEEQENVEHNHAYTWIIDPIDGTRAFSCGNPMFGTLIAVLHHNRPIIGVIDLPVLEQTWIGIEGMPTRLNGAEVHVSGREKLTLARLATTSGHALGEDYPKFEKLSQQAMVTSCGGDCANYAHLATGWCDIVAESQLNAHDIMAIIPVITGAGGVMTKWDGTAITFDDYDGTALASASTKLHDEALSVINS
jgi:histidinol phosphatase-like enzyme (inositol monophosphatase family)